MISVNEASSIVLNHLGDFGTEQVALHEAIGRVLKEDIYTDANFPSFDRVAMDGIAIAYESYSQGTRSFPVESMQPAGSPQQTLTNPSNCIEVMTGAMLPLGADVVIPYEEVAIVDGTASINISEAKQFQNVHKEASDQKKGALLLKQDNPISPAEIATLAAVGKHQVKVSKLPQVAIVSTGDELVEIDEIPLPHQIRKSNVHALVASLNEMNVSSTLIHLSDDREQIEKMLKGVLSNFDVVIMSGGVSKGKKDHIPDVLDSFDVKKHFHRVKQRPGKPFWFGQKENTTIFALPGNPVSTFLCFYKYVRPWILSSLGMTPKLLSAVLHKDFTFNKPLAYFMQVTVTNDKGILKASPVIGGGSGDFTNLNRTNGFLELPEDRSEFKAGEVYPYISYRY